ncbi:MAG: GTP 3',8-cyclase MoaA [Oscillospiraceae bacterium]|jgi:cyclic pyranopterin phosphate synthase|nr:GTP 3',8-cyclase MoaA [Oscillospiraceae bacterium]
MKDGFGREINYLRLSVTDLCNLRCKYCMPADGVNKLAHADILSVEEIEGIVRAAASLGITKVRITGGEPLVRRGILEICRRAAAVDGITEVCMTTNATLLREFAVPLREAGVSRLNISLDTLNAERYRELTRGGELADALDGIEAARAAGFGRIKLNAVLIGGENSDADIRALAELTRGGLNVRFIELMPIGETAEWARPRFLPNSAVLKAVPELTECGSDGVARLYRLPDADGTVGLISPVSSHFCPDCNRIRVTADGKLKPCLHSATEINLRGLRGKALTDAIKNAILIKPQRHRIDEGASGSLRNMNAIGG